MAFFPQEPGTHSGWAPILGQQFDYSGPSVQPTTTIASHVRAIATPSNEYQQLPPPPNSIHDFYNASTMGMSSQQPSTPVSPVATVPSSIPAYSAALQSGTPFRPSKYEVEREYIDLNPGSTFCQTSIFKK